MSKLMIIKEADGQEKAVMTMEFGIGQVHKEQFGENYILITQDVNNTKRVLKQLLQMNFNEETLEEYCKLWLFEKIGVTSFPLVRDENGDILGVSDNVEQEQGQ